MIILSLYKTINNSKANFSLRALRVIQPI